LATEAAENGVDEIVGEVITTGRVYRPAGVTQKLWTRTMVSGRSGWVEDHQAEITVFVVGAVVGIALVR
jgi:hypothetical protein